MELLQKLLAQKFVTEREEIASLIRDHGDFPISSVSLSQLLGGMRHVRALVCDTSVVDAQQGLSIRGLSIGKLQNHCPEEVFWLLLTGELPSTEELNLFRADLIARRGLPEYVIELLRSMPEDCHPMNMFNAAILAMQHESRFAAQYGDSSREELWRPALEDALQLFANLPLLAAKVRQVRYKLPDNAVPDTPDWTADFAARLLGRNGKALEELLQRYVVVQSDHESGNVCAFAAHITGSTHADPYYAISAGLNGLAGHIHGLAAQDFIRFLLDLPVDASQAELKVLLQERLAEGMVIPGFGHAVLRSRDPRFEILKQHAAEHFPDDPLYGLASRVYQAATEVLAEHPRVKNPHPNVDAITGVVLRLSGIHELEFYTVLFGTALSIGMLAQYVISRGIGSPIVRPRSVSMAEIRRMLPGS